MRTATHTERQALEASRRERAALAWLAEQPGVADALDLGENGEEEKAIKQLAEVVGAILFGEDQQRTEPAPKCRRLETTGTRDASPSDEAAPKDPNDTEVAKPARCVCILLSGMRGAGKTTLCNVLQKVIGGEHIQFDEITKANPSEKKAFQSCLKKAVANSLRATKSEKRPEGPSRTSPQQEDAEPEGPLAPKKLSDRDKLVYVDRTHLLSAQRREVISLLHKFRWRERQCRTLLLEFKHSSDVFGYGTDGQLSKRFGQNHIALCAERIGLRGSAHPVLRPSAKLHGILRKEAKAAEPPSPSELRHFDACFTVEVAENPAQQVIAVIQELKRLGWLQVAFDADTLCLQVELAWQVYCRAQDAWRRSVQEKGTAPDSETREKREWLAQCRQAAEETAAVQGEAKPNDKVTWKFDLPEVRQILLQRGSLPAGFEIKDDTVVELLQVPTDGDMERAAKEQGLEVDALEAMKDALEALQGETFDVRMTKILISQTTACALVTLPPVVPHVGKVPHVVLGTRQGAPPASIEELLKQATDEANCVTCIELPESRPLSGRLVLANG